MFKFVLLGVLVILLYVAVTYKEVVTTPPTIIHVIIIVIGFNAVYDILKYVLFGTDKGDELWIKIYMLTGVGAFFCSVFFYYAPAIWPPLAIISVISFLFFYIVFLISIMRIYNLKDNIKKKS